MSKFPLLLRWSLTGIVLLCVALPVSAQEGCPDPDPDPIPPPTSGSDDRTYTGGGGGLLNSNLREVQGDLPALVASIRGRYLAEPGNRRSLERELADKLHALFKARGLLATPNGNQLVVNSISANAYLSRREPIYSPSLTRYWLRPGFTLNLEGYLGGVYGAGITVQQDLTPGRKPIVDALLAYGDSPEDLQPLARFLLATNSDNPAQTIMQEWSRFLMSVRVGATGYYKRFAGADATFLGATLSKIVPLGGKSKDHRTPGLFLGATVGPSHFENSDVSQLTGRLGLTLALQDAVPAWRPTSAGGATGYTVWRWAWRLGLEAQPRLSDATGSAFGGFLAYRFLPAGLYDNKQALETVGDITEFRVSGGHRTLGGPYVFLSLTRNFK